MASPGKDGDRMKSYKNKALNPQEMRRRREEEGIQLRKQKREEQVKAENVAYVYHWEKVLVFVVTTLLNAHCSSKLTVSQLPLSINRFGEFVSLR